MVLNPDYDSDDEDWDMVDPADEDTTATVTAAEEEGLLPPTIQPSRSTTPPVEPLVANDVTTEDPGENVDGTALSQFVSEESRGAGTAKDAAVAAGLPLSPPEADTATPTVPMPIKSDPEVIRKSGAAAEARDTDAAAVDEATPLSGSTIYHQNDPRISSTTEPPHDPEPSPRPPSSRRASAWAVLGSSLKQIGSALQKLDEQHDWNVQEKARRSFHNLKSSAQQWGHVVEDESRKLSQSVQQKAQSLELEEKAHRGRAVVERQARQLGETLQQTVQQAGASLQSGARKARHQVQTWNKDGQVANFLTAAAVVGAGVWVAQGVSQSSSGSGNGKPGLAVCGAAVLATGGATYMASQAFKERSHRQYSASLNEDLPME